MHMSEHVSAGPIWTCVKVDDYFNPSSADTLARVKMIETFVESAFATCM
jgi:hypothetical protein